MTDYITDNFGQIVGPGDIIVYVGCSSSTPHITRAEVLEIVTPRTQRQSGSYTFWSDYKMKVRAEGSDRKSSTLTRAPFILVANAIDFDEYVASLRVKYGMEEE